jgi:hypothetical protein
VGQHRERRGDVVQVPTIVYRNREAEFGGESLVPGELCDTEFGEFTFHSGLDGRSPGHGVDQLNPAVGIEDRHQVVQPVQRGDRVDDHQDRPLGRCGVPAPALRSDGNLGPLTG